jgi:hypothetical protein
LVVSLMVAVAGVAVGTDALAGVANSLLDRAGERALSYEREALQWTCTETLVRATYDTRGGVARETERRFAVLLAEGKDEPADKELRIPEPPTEIERFPPATSWLRLFHPAHRHLVSFAVRSDEARQPAVDFRGALPLRQGDRILEWEGTAWLDATTGDLLKVEAIPRAQSGHVQDRLRRHPGVRVALFQVLRFRVGPKTRARRVEVVFGDIGEGFWLPRSARLETSIESPGRKARRESTVTELLTDCRQFDTSAAGAMSR